MFVDMGEQPFGHGIKSIVEVEDPAVDGLEASGRVND
jgi:hypothetical protein